MKLPYVSLAIVSGFMLVLLIGWAVFAGPPQEEKMSIEQRLQKSTDVDTTPKNVDVDPSVVDEPENVPDDIRTGATIDLHGQNITEVPSYVFQRLGIEKLDLSQNALKGSLQAEVRYLSNLKVLDLSDNAFTGVPAEVGQLTKLEILDLSNNNLTGLPYELGALQNLKTLDLRGNGYAKADLEKIKETLPKTTVVLVD